MPAPGNGNGWAGRASLVKDLFSLATILLSIGATGQWVSSRLTAVEARLTQYEAHTDALTKDQHTHELNLVGHPALSATIDGLQHRLFDRLLGLEARISRLEAMTGDRRHEP